MIVQRVSGEERGWEGGCMCTRVVGVGGRVKKKTLSMNATKMATSSSSTESYPARCV